MPPTNAIEVGVSEFVALLNQTLEYAYPGVTVVGELANFRVSRGKWVYFDLKDDDASVKFFGSVYQLPGPLEDGMLLKVRGVPRLHNLYGFSVNVTRIQPTGEGTIRRAAELLKAKLAKEGLFDESRKRPLPYPPPRLGLIAAGQSAAYADFIKILNARWQGIKIEHIDVQVQGDAAPGQIVAAIEQFNSHVEPPAALVIIRGGGSAEDLAAFSTESVTRAVAASRVPTLVAVGHEIDLSLAELAADRRASTPSNAAELLVPDRRQVLSWLQDADQQMRQCVQRRFQSARDDVSQRTGSLDQLINHYLQAVKSDLRAHSRLLEALNPKAVLRRGYAIVRHQQRAVRRARDLRAGSIVDVQLAAGGFSAGVKQVRRGNG
jgi:exodeoxyribonuclease VII large subunit